MKRVLACFDCAQACAACTDACLGEQEISSPVRCIRDDLDCADICLATGNVLSRQTRPSWEVTREILEACAASCRQGGDTCEVHADHHEHCRMCMEACRRCESACNNVLSANRDEQLATCSADLARFFTSLEPSW